MNYKVALKLTSGDGALASYQNDVISGRVRVDVRAGVSWVSGSIAALTNAGMPVPVPFTELPQGFRAYPCGTLLQGPNGETSFPTSAGTVTIGWTAGANIHLRVTMQFTGAAALLAKSAALDGAARVDESVPVTPPAPPPGPVGSRDGAPSYWLERNWYKLSDADETAGLDAVAAAGLWGVNIEMPRSSCQIPLARLVGKCRARGLRLLVVLHNDNSHLPKHQNTPWMIGDHADVQASHIEAAKLLDRKLDIINPVAEEQTPAGSAFAARCVRELADWTLADNNGSRPERARAGYERFAFHVNSLDQRPPRGALAVTDTSGAIQGMCRPGENFEDGKGFDPAKAAAWVLRCNGWGNQAHVYGYKHKAVDFASIAAIGTAWRAGQDTGTPGTPTGNAFTFSRYPVNGEWYVAWPSWCDRTGWPEKYDKKMLNGQLWGCLVGGTPRKIEWIGVGRNDTGTQNAVHDPDYKQAGWNHGVRVHLEIRDIHGVMRDPRYKGECVV